MKFSSLDMVRSIPKAPSSIRNSYHSKNKSEIVSSKINQFREENILKSTKAKSPYYIKENLNYQKNRRKSITTLKNYLDFDFRDPYILKNISPISNTEDPKNLNLSQTIANKIKDVEDLEKLKSKILKQEKFIKKLTIENEKIDILKSEIEVLKKELLTAKALQKSSEIKEKPTQNKEPISLFSNILALHDPINNADQDLKNQLAEEKKKTDHYKDLFEQEKQKTVRLDEEIKILKNMIDVLKVSINEDSMEYLKSKNLELLNQILKNADDLYEKSLEIREITKQKNQILKEFNSANNKALKVPQLKEHIFTLLTLINKLRSKINKVAEKHNSVAGTEESSKHSSILSDVKKISKDTEIDLLKLLQTSLPGIDIKFSGKNFENFL